MNRLFKKLYAPIAWTILIQVLLCLPGPSLPQAPVFNIPHLDKLVHFIIYFGLVSGWCYSFYLNTAVDRVKKYFLIILLIAVVHGIMIEYLQLYFIPYRSFDGNDILADMAGAFSGYAIVNSRVKIKKPL